jgi:hypothetical protein
MRPPFGNGVRRLTGRDRRRKSRRRRPRHRTSARLEQCRLERRVPAPTGRRKRVPVRRVPRPDPHHHLYVAASTTVTRSAGRSVASNACTTLAGIRGSPRSNRRYLPSDPPYAARATATTSAANSSLRRRLRCRSRASWINGSACGRCRGSAIEIALCITVDSTPRRIVTPTRSGRSTAASCGTRTMANRSGTVCCQGSEAARARRLGRRGGFVHRGTR